MCEAVPDALVDGYRDLIDGLTLPDADDRHVLAAAIRSGSQVIVTENLNDFPKSVLQTYDIEAQGADVFVLHLIDLAPATVLGVVQEQAADLSAPSMTVSQLLGRLEGAGLPRSVAELRRLGGRPSGRWAWA